MVSYFENWTDDLDCPMLHFEGRSWTRRAVIGEVRRLSHYFQSLGVEAGSRVMILLENSPQLLFSVFASHRLGFIVVPLNPRYSEAEMDHVLGDSGPSLILSGAGRPAPAGAVSLALHDLAPGERAVASPAPDAGAAQEADTDPGPDPADPAFLIYTSGTTSRPKGVLLSHGNVLACLKSLREAWQWTSADRLLLALPLFHVHGLIVGACGSVWNGSEILLRRGFDAAATWQDLQQTGCTLFMGVPTMYQRLLDQAACAPSGAVGFPSETVACSEIASSAAPRSSARKPDGLSRVRLFISGSAPLPAQTHRAFQRLSGHQILERYGMTETLMVLSNPCQGARKPGSAGVPLPGVEVRLVDENGMDAEPEKIGEIWVRGDAVFREYWKNRGATQAAFHQGWFKTGDMATRDREGYFFIAGRKSVDIIKCYGFKISALEIEDALLQLPSVEAAAVVAAPDPDKGDEIVAFLKIAGEMRAGAAAAMGAPGLGSLLGADVGGLLDCSLARYKHPTRYILVDELPRNAMGKVSKVELKRRLQSGANG